MLICFSSNNQLKQYFLFISQPRLLKCLWNKHVHVSIPLQFIKPMFQTPILRCPPYSPACTPTRTLSQHHAPSTTISILQKSGSLWLPASLLSPLPPQSSASLNPGGWALTGPLQPWIPTRAGDASRASPNPQQCPTKALETLFIHQILPQRCLCAGSWGHGGN